MCEYRCRRGPKRAGSGRSSGRPAEAGLLGRPKSQTCLAHTKRPTTQSVKRRNEAAKRHQAGAKAVGLGRRGDIELSKGGATGAAVLRKLRCCGTAVRRSLGLALVACICAPSREASVRAFTAAGGQTTKNQNCEKRMLRCGGKLAKRVVRLLHFVVRRRALAFGLASVPLLERPPCDHHRMAARVKYPRARGDVG